MIISDNCTGCRACEQICPRKCISMQADYEGFLVPVIDESLCVKCGICKLKCPANAENIPSQRLPTVYAARIIDSEILKVSTSGGVFACMALDVISAGGYVFGAAYDDNLAIKHICINKIEDLHKLQGSKYVQSNTMDTYSYAEILLNSDKIVLYSGTPCQIAGLYSYLGKDYQNLITADLICHGVPSPLLFKKYLGWLEYKTKRKIVSYTFRAKDKCDSNTNYINYTADKKYLIPAHIDPFGINFGNAHMSRRCCYKCKYTTIHRISDITLGDYWGIDKHHPDFMDKTGNSVVLLNTDKGEKFFNNLKHRLFYLKSDISKVIEKNPRLSYPPSIPDIRNEIYAGINQLNDYEYVQKRLAPSISLKSLISMHIPKSIKMSIKRIIGR